MRSSSSSTQHLILMQRQCPSMQHQYYAWWKEEPKLQSIHINKYADIDLKCHHEQYCQPKIRQNNITTLKLNAVIIGSTKLGVNWTI